MNKEKYFEDKQIKLIKHKFKKSGEKKQFEIKNIGYESSISSSVTHRY